MGLNLSSMLRALSASMASLLLLGCGDGRYDIVLQGGLLVDGTGAPASREDLAIRAGRIAARGQLADARAERRIDARGLVVAPGFIDVLGHSGLGLLADPAAASKVQQGVTTEITGEGRSVAPQNDRTRGELVSFAERHGVAVDWNDFDGYFRRLEERGTAINIGSYVGATQVRKVVIGRENRRPSAAELARMRRLVREAMEQGAFGLSSALVYPPASYAQTDELVALAGEAAAHDGIYATHMRSEGPRMFQALEEVFDIARATDARIEIFHLKAAGPEMHGRMEEIVARIESARDSGLDISADVYPYTAASTSLAATLPPWVHADGISELLRRLRDPGARARMRQQIGQPGTDWEDFYRMAGGADGILISEVSRSELERYRGMRLDELADAWNLDPVDALLRLLADDEASTQAIFFLTTERDLVRALESPWVGIATDAAALGSSLPAGSHPHPRALGTFPRVIRRYVMEEGRLSLEEAIHKMTALPARRLHLEERGELKPGFHADVVAFDPDRIRDFATYEEPTRRSAGIEYVLVNGELVLEEGRMTEARPGRALRGPGWRGPNAHGPEAPLTEAPMCRNDAIQSAPGPLVAIVAHPVDATLGFAGPLFEAAREGREVRVVILTDGRDDCVACALWKWGEPREERSGCTDRELDAFGHVRRHEAVSALGLLGVARRDVTFLGHGAGTLRAAWEEPSGPPGGPTCRHEGPAAAAGPTGEMLIRDLEALSRELPERATVLTTHPYDGDPDHGAAYEFVRRAFPHPNIDRRIFLTVLRDNADQPCSYPNPTAERCSLPTRSELATSPGLLAQLREARYRPESWWTPPSDVDYGEPLAFCLSAELHQGSDALKRRAIDRHETYTGVRERRGMPVASAYRGWADPAGRLLSFVHRNEVLYPDDTRDLASVVRGEQRRPSAD